MRGQERNRERNLGVAGLYSHMHRGNSLKFQFAFDMCKNGAQDICFGAEWYLPPNEMHVLLAFHLFKAKTLHV